MEARKDHTVEDLEKIVESPNVLTSGLQDFQKDMGDFPSEPLAVVQPSSSDQVSLILKMLNVRKIPVVARGGGTSLTGATSCFGGVVIDFTKRMNHVLEIDTTNWYVHCEAGLVLEDLNEELKKYGFFFPPDPASSPWCTVGGVISENSGGMRTFRYGTVKNWVLALKVVLADGSIIKLGEPLPKNRIGYDLVHLVCGSEGTLAVITEAWLKIAPLPGAHGTLPAKKFMVFFSNWNDAVSAITGIRSNGVEPNLIEFLSRESVAAVNGSFDTKIPEYEAALFFEATQDLVAKIVEICEKSHSVMSYVGKDEKDEDRLYSARALLLLGIKALDTGVLNEDIVVPLNKLAEYLARVKEVSKKYNLQIPTAGHAGDGNVHPAIVFHAESAESRDAANKAFEELIDEALKLGGSASGEHGVGTQKLQFANRQLLQRNGKKAVDLMRSLKRAWDPNGILNPGKFISLDESGGD